MTPGQKIHIQAEILRVHGNRADVQLINGVYVPGIKREHIMAVIDTKSVEAKAIESAPANKAIRPGQNK